MSRVFDILLLLFFTENVLIRNDYNLFLICLHMITDSTTAI